MSILAYAHLPSLQAAISTRAKLPKPRGLWKAARETPKDVPAPKRPRQDDHYNRPRSAQHHDGDGHTSSDGDCCDSDSSVSKRFRFIDTPPTSEEDGQDEVIFWDYSRQCSSQPERVSKWTTRSKVMDTSSTAGPGQLRLDRTTYTLEDWEDLKELFSKAVDIYESEFVTMSADKPNISYYTDQEPQETIPFLRAVIHECHRFMKVYQDPSSLYAPPAQPEQPTKLRSSNARVFPEWIPEPPPPPLYPPPSDTRSNFKDDREQQTSRPTITEPEKKWYEI